jgi:hypothetical protein
MARAAVRRLGRGTVLADEFDTPVTQLNKKMTNLNHFRLAGRDGFHEEARETLALLRGTNQTINLVLIAQSDGVELEVWADGALRRRARFLRDTEARKYSDRLTTRLARRGYQHLTELR